MRTTTILPTLAIALLVAAGCNGQKASNAAQNAANAAGNAANAAGNAAGNAANAAGNAAGTAGQAASNAAQGAANAAGNAAGAAGQAAGSMGNAASNAAGNAMQSAGQAATNMTRPNCGAVQAVWVNTRSRVYREPGDPLYAKTKHGMFLCPSQAKAQGYHLWRGHNAPTNDSSM